MFEWGMPGSCMRVKFDIRPEDGGGVLEPRPETNAISQGQKTTMTLLTEAPVPDLYTLEVVTSRLAKPRTMTGGVIQI